LHPLGDIEAVFVVNGVPHFRRGWSCISCKAFRVGDQIYVDTLGTGLVIYLTEILVLEITALEGLKELDIGRIILQPVSVFSTKL